MRSTKLELASVGTFALIVKGFGFTQTDEGAGGSQGMASRIPKATRKRLVRERSMK
jgi:hypothetical protein